MLFPDEIFELTAVLVERRQTVTDVPLIFVFELLGSRMAPGWRDEPYFRNPEVASPAVYA
ncbi:hypothetical protein [Streptomyces sp. NBC_00212]|uniref:hypothetical protein n=1 Tax=Streptomyces sp. NBC_00212 TaxID=2975684 RepID=UPI0032538605